MKVAWQRWIPVAALVGALASGCVNAQQGVVAPGATLTKVGEGFQFTEGPATAPDGSVYFTDVRASRIHRWSPDGAVTTFREDTGGANGLFFDQAGNLLACEGGGGRVVSIDVAGKVTVVADAYNGQPFNRPNDLWIDPDGGVYFSDPLYGGGEKHQDGEHVYYVSPDRQRVLRVVDDMVRPNGLIGTPDGKTLYIADAGAGKTYRYSVNPDGTLADKTLFASSGSDGMTMDERGNVYLTAQSVLVLDPSGEQIAQIAVPEPPTNLTFGGADRKTLFITARSTVWSIAMAVSGARPLDGGAGAEPTPGGMVLIPGGTFQMGDHHNLGGREHRNDEVPIHEVTLDPFYMGICEVTNEQYCGYLNSALRQGSIAVQDGFVYPKGKPEILCETRAAVPYSRIGWDGTGFAVLDGKAQHPMIGVRWEGAVTYCNWLSEERGLEPCYDLSTWACDYSKAGFRLPTEAEWEYAGRGGLHDPYRVYPWGDDADYSRANWPNSGDPFEAGAYPWTTPVGFYTGELRHRAEFDWPRPQDTYQTSDGSNGYGLYDMAGNVWEWCNDWYTQDYYASGPSVNPEGPAEGRPMPDGKPYRVLRSGNWFNGPEGHSRVSNRNPSYYRGPNDPDHAWYHIGFRVVRDFEGDGPRVQSGAPRIIGPPAAQPVPDDRRGGARGGRRPPRGGPRRGGPQG